METTMERRRAPLRQPLAALGKLTVAALIVIALMMTYAQVLIGAFEPLLAIFGLVALMIAGVMAVGWRWTPLLGALWCGLMIALNVDGVVDDLTHPASTWFALNAVIFPLMLVGIMGGVAATVQNYRSAERRAPRWLPAALTALGGLVLGAILVATLVQSGTSAGISPEALAQFPALTAKDYAFSQKEIRAKAGETIVLRLTNADAETHYFDIDELNIHTAIPTDKDGVAIFKPTQPGTYTFYCHPHADKAAGTGMVGTLIVAP